MEDGSQVLVELDETTLPPSDVETAGVGDRVADSFEGLFEKARPVINGIVKGLGTLDLDQVSVKFSLKVTTEGKILFIASAKAEGGIELAMTWKPNRPASAPQVH